MMCSKLDGIVYALFVWHILPTGEALFSADKCEDSGTDEIKYGTRIYKVGANKSVYRTNWTWPYDLDSQVSGRIQVAKWGISGWSTNFYNDYCPYMCEGIKKRLPEFFDAYCSAIKIKNECPIPANQYALEDMNLEVTNLLPSETLPFGKYRIDTLYFRNDVKIGCFRFIAEVSPKYH